MVSFLLALGAILFGFGAYVAFELNATPMPPGPIPFFGSALLSLACIIALIARHLVWR